VIESPLQAAILRLLLASAEPVTRTELGLRLGVGRNAVGHEVRRLLDAGVLEAAGFTESRGGRRSLLVRVSAAAGYVGAIDLGATSIDVAITTLASEVVAQAAEEIDVAVGPGPILDKAAAMLRDLLAGQGADLSDLRAVGLGVPGPVAQADGHVVAPPLMPGWNDFPVRDAFAELVACPVFVDNDVNLMAIGEHARGVARDVGDFVFVKVGTGIGTGLFVNFALVRGADGCAGDLGHVCVEPAGPTCTCGNVGCLEAVAAGPAIARAGEEAARTGRAPLLAATLERKGVLDARDVGDAAGHGDLGALAVVRAAAGRIGAALATMVSLLNPSAIVIGGGVSGIGHVFLAEIRTAVYARSLPLATRNLPIVPSALGANAGVIGASVVATELLVAVADVREARWVPIDH
jgi:glucokinase-like ROK family protein